MLVYSGRILAGNSHGLWTLVSAAASSPMLYDDSLYLRPWVISVWRPWSLVHD